MSLKKKQFNLKTLLFMCELRIYFKDEADFEKIKNPTLPFFFSCHLCEFLTLLKQFFILLLCSSLTCNHLEYM